MRNIQILAISGSLRSKSSNTAVLQALQKLAPETTKITLYSEKKSLSTFVQAIKNTTIF
ncbi:MAG: hypothetical protein ACRC2S_09195 [Waterburya sp.]